jgi:hypothetical protein
MRFIVTSETLVEKFKQEAKRVKRKHKGTHADALDRVARQYGYNHWHHVMACAKQTASEGMTIAAACEDYVERAKAKRNRVGGKDLNPEDPPLVLFSTEEGDAWVVHPVARKALCLCWRGERQDFKIQEDRKGVAVIWDSDFRPAENFGFAVDSQNPKVGKQVIFGYPIEAIERVADPYRYTPEIRHIFLGEGLEPITDALIDELVASGWTRERLIEARELGHSYSRPRNTIITQIMSSDDEANDDA